MQVALVRDYDEAIAFYARKLGFRLSRTLISPNGRDYSMLTDGVAFVRTRQEAAYGTVTCSRISTGRWDLIQFSGHA